MSKVEYKCDICPASYFKWPSQVRGERKYCSLDCKRVGQSIHSTGAANSNYKSGAHCEDSICECGGVKDYRARQCSGCKSNLEAKIPDFFKIGTPRRNATLWRYIKSLDLIPWEACVDCGQGWEHNGKYLSLHLDHINGESSDNRLENLRVLCPNCHTQTPTYAAKNRRKK